MLVGAVMMFFDIRDEGMIIKLGGMEFIGSMVGFAMFAVCLTVILLAKPKVKLKK